MIPPPSGAHQISGNDAGRQSVARALRGVKKETQWINGNDFFL
jgi:hypothetical protein